MTGSGVFKRHWKALVVTSVIAVAALAVGVPYVYIHAIEGSQPAALTLSDAPSTVPSTSDAPAATTTSGSVDGTWTVATGSQAGYRVHETLAGQSTVAVGRTSSVTGSLKISGTSVTAASFTVQMATVTSDRSQRDGQFSGRIMDTAQYPTGTFVLTKPIDFGKVPAPGKVVTVRASGNLTLHGTTKPVTFTMAAKRVNNQIDITGDIPIVYANYNIDNPSFGGFVSVGNTGTVEFLLVTAKA